jgi:hypothetical protein
MTKMDAKKFKKQMADLKPGEGIEVDDKTNYEFGADLSTEGVPLVDPGSGKTVSIRVFTFKINPEKVKSFPSDKQALFNAHAKQIETILWGDGLRPFDSNPPRVIINLKKGIYQIFVPCEAKRDVTFTDKPKNLSELLKKPTRQA